MQLIVKKFSSWPEFAKVLFSKLILMKLLLGLGESACTSKRNSLQANSEYFKKCSCYAHKLDQAL